jgi:hypothetical protein
LFNRINRNLKQVTVRASRASKLLFQGSSSNSSRQRGEEEQHGEEEQCGEEAENVGEGPNEEEEAELERVLRQTRRSHLVTPPIASAREEDRVLIRPVDDR